MAPKWSALMPNRVKRWIRKAKQKWPYSTPTISPALRRQLKERGPPELRVIRAEAQREMEYRLVVGNLLMSQFVNSLPPGLQEYQRMAGMYSPTQITGLIMETPEFRALEENHPARKLVGVVRKAEADFIKRGTYWNEKLAATQTSSSMTLSPYASKRTLVLMGIRDSQIHTQVADALRLADDYREYFAKTQARPLDQNGIDQQLYTRLFGILGKDTNRFISRYRRTLFAMENALGVEEPKSQA